MTTGFRLGDHVIATQEYIQQRGTYRGTVHQARFDLDPPVEGVIIGWELLADDNAPTSDNGTYCYLVADALPGVPGLGKTCVRAPTDAVTLKVSTAVDR